VTLSTPGAEATHAGRTHATERGHLLAEVEAELTSWNPRQFLSAFRRLHHDSVSLIHLNVLSLLEADDALSMSRLAESLDVSLASATGIVDRMEARHLVERRRTPADRRVVLVAITDGGRRVLTAIDERRRQGLAGILDRLTDDELRALLVGHRALKAARLAAKAETVAETSDAGPSTAARA